MYLDPAPDFVKICQIKVDRENNDTAWTVFITKDSHHKITFL